MESPKAEMKALRRLQLVLGKFPIVHVRKRNDIVALGDQEITISFPNNICIVMLVPSIADVREGDLLTIYTEVLTHAPTQPTPIQ